MPKGVYVVDKETLEIKHKPEAANPSNLKKWAISEEREAVGMKLDIPKNW